MSSWSGYISYLDYTAGSNKGATKQGDVFNSVLGLGNVDTNYTSSKVVEAIGSSATKFEPAWTPVDGKVEGHVVATGAWEEIPDINTFTQGKYDKARYTYDNVVIPQNDLPVLNVEMKGIDLHAKARRIAIYYSQMAAYQAKNDYGFDMGEELAAKAVGQLSYEIDTEICNGLIAAAPSDSDLVWSKTLPVGVSKQEHYAGFVEVLEIAAQKIFDRTKRFAPNYMLISSSIRPILAFVPGFEAAPKGNVNGPHFIGTLNGLKVYVTPNIDEGRFVVGCNGGGAESSAAVFAPYMPIVPTQLVGYADGGMSQGWSTLYDFKIINANLLVAGNVVA